MYYKTQHDMERRIFFRYLHKNSLETAFDGCVRFTFNTIIFLIILETHSCVSLQIT